MLPLSFLITKCVSCALKVWFGCSSELQTLCVNIWCCNVMAQCQACYSVPLVLLVQIKK